MRLAARFRERRREQRHETASAARLRIGDAWVPTSVVNLSKGGAALLTDMRPEPGSPVLVEIDDLGFFLCRVVRHLDAGIAVRFESATFPDPDPPAGTDSP